MVSYDYFKGYKLVCNALSNLISPVEEYLKIASTGYLNYPDDFFLKNLKAEIDEIENPNIETDYSLSTIHLRFVQ
jgi:hypothetical protein